MLKPLQHIFDASGNRIILTITDCSGEGENIVLGRCKEKDNVDKQKKQWISYCELLVKTLKKDKNLISLKLKHVQWIYDIVHIYVIFISSILTCFETIKIEFNIPTKSTGDSILSLLTLFFTASVVISMSITKYLRYSETIQNILIVSNEGVEVICKLRQAIEDTASCETVASLRTVILKNKKEVCTPFYKVREEIDRHLPIYDRIKYNKIYEAELHKEVISRKNVWEKRQVEHGKYEINDADEELNKKCQYIYGDPYGDEADTAWDNLWAEKKKAMPPKYILPLVLSDLGEVYLPSSPVDR